MYYAFVYSTGVPMAKTAILVGIISMIVMQSVSDASKINNQDHVKNGTETLLCAHADKKTKLKVRGSATGLADKDGWTAGQSDPYMEVIATENSWYTHELKTPIRGGTNNPTWNDYLVFEEKIWMSMTVFIMDYDGSDRNPDKLCYTGNFALWAGTHSETFDCNPGTATVEYVC